MKKRKEATEEATVCNSVLDFICSTGLCVNGQDTYNKYVSLTSQLDLVELKALQKLLKKISN